VRTRIWHPVIRADVRAVDIRTRFTLAGRHYARVGGTAERNAAESVVLRLASDMNR
jgi:hypothetical protein